MFYGFQQCFLTEYENPQLSSVVPHAAGPFLLQTQSPLLDKKNAFVLAPLTSQGSKKGQNDRVLSNFTKSQGRITPSRRIWIVGP
jgi:hypothetical protein